MPPFLCSINKKRTPVLRVLYNNPVHNHKILWLSGAETTAYGGFAGILQKATGFSTAGGGKMWWFLIKVVEMGGTGC